MFFFFSYHLVKNIKQILGKKTIIKETRCRKNAKKCFVKINIVHFFLHRILKKKKMLQKIVIKELFD